MVSAPRAAGAARETQQVGATREPELREPALQTELLGKFSSSRPYQEYGENDLLVLSGILAMKSEVASNNEEVSRARRSSETVECSTSTPLRPARSGRPESASQP